MASSNNQLPPAIPGGSHFLLPRNTTPRLKVRFEGVEEQAERRPPTGGLTPSKNFGGSIADFRSHRLRDHTANPSPLVKSSSVGNFFNSPNNLGNSQRTKEQAAAAKEARQILTNEILTLSQKVHSYLEKKKFVNLPPIEHWNSNAIPTKTMHEIFMFLGKMLVGKNFFNGSKDQIPNQISKLMEKIDYEVKIHPSNFKSAHGGPEAWKRILCAMECLCDSVSIVYDHPTKPKASWYCHPGIPAFELEINQAIIAFHVDNLQEISHINQGREKPLNNYEKNFKNKHEKLSERFAQYKEMEKSKLELEALQKHKAQAELCLQGWEKAVTDVQLALEETKEKSRVQLDPKVFRKRFKEFLNGKK